MDSTLYFAHFLAWGCRTAWIKTCGFRSSYSKSRPKKRMLIGKHHGRGWQHPLLSCLGRVPALAPVVAGSLLMPLELLSPAFTHLKFWLFFTLFLNYQWQFSLLYGALLLTLHPVMSPCQHSPSVCFSIPIKLILFPSVPFFIHISICFLIPLLISPP